jgi:hypothetical protein
VARTSELEKGADLPLDRLLPAARPMAPSNRILVTQASGSTLDRRL